MKLELSQEANQIITYSKEEAMRLGNYNIDTPHFMLGILRQEHNHAVHSLKALGVNIHLFKKNIEDSLRNHQIISFDQQDQLLLTKQADKMLRQAYLESLSLKHEKPTAAHLLLAILKDEEGLSAQLLKKSNIDYASVYNQLSPKETHDPRAITEYDEEAEAMPSGNKPSKQQSAANPQKQSDTPILDNFGVDLTAYAAEGKLDPVVGREREIERLAQILSRRKKNNPILIGEPGVGKSAIAEGLALQIAQKKVSRVLAGKRIVALDVGSIVAGTKYRGQFEERMKGILNELTKSPNIILFIDEIHTIVGAGGAAGTLDAANMLKPALARGELQCIGATTLDEYREYIEKDGALERRFQKIMVEPTSPEETIEILSNIKERYEKHHHVVYTPESLRACVSLTQRYITDRCLPDKAIDALDEAGSRVHISNITVPDTITVLEKELEDIRAEKREAVAAHNYERAAELRDTERSKQMDLDISQKHWNEESEKNRQTVDEEQVAEVVSMMANIPIHRVAEAEMTRLLKMADELKGRIVGQDEAIEKVVKAIRRNRAGLKDPNKPIGTFIFLGPTGVGKTQLAKVLSQYLFDTTDSMIRIDMSEYMEKFAISRLIGAPPGYVGYEEGGQLTERVRRKPYSVVLLDEIEKAHPDLFNLLLQVFDEGRLTDSNGRYVDFRNTVLIMTSNIGSRELKDFGRGVGFATATNRDMAENTRSVIEKALGKTFTPEFLNRVDENIIFNPLSKEDIFKIIDIELAELYTRIDQLGYKVEITPTAKDFVAEKGYDSLYGARPLKRAVQKYLEDNMAEAIIRLQLKPGQVLKVSLNDEQNDLVVDTEP